MTYSRVLAFFVGLLVVVVSTRAAGVEKDPPAKVSLMKRKLQHAQKLLEGITKKNFKTIEQNAGELVDISRQAEWREYKTPLYEKYSDQFRRQALEMMNNAKDKRLESATLNYFEITLTCVRCHEHVRQIKMAGLTPDRSDNFAKLFETTSR